MPVVLKGSRSQSAPLPAGNVLSGSTMAASCIGAGPAGGRTAPVIEIGLLNNMPDAALQSTERQFVELISAAAGELTVRMRFVSLPAVPRGEAAASHLQATYADIHELRNGELDALIVTGAEPRAACLHQEPYWNSLSAIIDWAEHNTISTIWSCLAAHAAVLHLDGVRRQPLEEKRFGVFGCAPSAADPLVSGLTAPLRVPHARWNELKESELIAHGYRVLTRSPDAGVDLFTKQWRSLFVFFQGHPEYDADALLREYRRDIGRFLRGESEICPPVPRNYLDARSQRALEEFAAAGRERRHGEWLASFPEELTLRPELARYWRIPAIPVMRNWLNLLAARKA